MTYKNVNRYDDNFFLFLISCFVIHFPVALKLFKMKFVTGDNHNEMTEKRSQQNEIEFFFLFDFSHFMTRHPPSCLLTYNK